MKKVTVEKLLVTVKATRHHHLRTTLVFKLDLDTVKINRFSRCHLVRT